MKLVEYKRQHKNDLEMLKEQDMSNIRTNHAYEGKLEHIRDIRSGVAIHLIKKEDIELFKNGENEITIYSVVMHENYVGKGSVALSHSISSHANGLFVDEVKSILEKYPDNEYSIITATNYGQFFAYTEFTEGVDYTKVRTTQDDLAITTLTFLNADIKEDFSWEFEDLISIQDVLNEISSLTISEEVIFVHHEDGVGYASRNFDKLKEIAGYVYSNYLIVD